MVFAVGLWTEAKMTEIEYFCEYPSTCCVSAADELMDSPDRTPRAAVSHYAKVTDSS
jgi:hypothetical protein